MELGFNEEQEMLRAASRDFLEKECPKSLVREMEKNEKGYSPELWRKMADLGWMGLIIPEKYGGSGGSILDLIILLEEMGRVILPAPFFETLVLGALPVLDFGSEEQKNELLPKIAGGELILTLAWLGPSVTYDAKGITVSAKSAGDKYIINGTNLFVPYAHVADLILCVTRTEHGTKPEEGITLFLLDANTPGISVTVLDTIADDKQCEVIFKNVQVSDSSILGDANQGWKILEKILQQASVAECALMVGGCQQVLEISTEFAKTRVQFGVPIGTFQATAHRCADQKIDTDTARYITYQAAFWMDEGVPCAREVSMAKVWVNEAYRRVCAAAHHTHGAIGFTADHDLGLYTRRARAAGFAFGDTDFHLEKVAQQLGL